MKILIAEDDSTSRLVLRMLLVRAGHEVTEAADGVPALALALETRFDLLIVDLQMPRMDGIEVIRAIRERERGSDGHLPVMALTAHAGADAARACLSAGADMYLAKPVTGPALMTALEALRGGTPSGAALDAPTVPSPVPASAGPAVTRLMEQTGVDAGVASNLVETALRYLPELAARIRRAVTEENRAALEADAHAFGGSCGLFDLPLQATAREIEATARTDDWNRLAGTVAVLESRLGSLEAELRSFMAGWARDGSVAGPPAG